MLHLRKYGFYAIYAGIACYALGIASLLAGHQLLWVKPAAWWCGAIGGTLLAVFFLGRLFKLAPAKN